MKKVLSILLILCLLLSCACGKAAGENEAPADNAETQPRATVEVSAGTEDKIKSMLPALEKIIEYQAINSYNLDMTNLSSEDFWNVISLCLTGCHWDGLLDDWNVFHLTLDNAREYARTFVGQSYDIDGLPRTNESYCAQWSGGEYQIEGLDLTNKVITLSSIMESSTIGDYIVCFDVADDEDGTNSSVRRIYLANWEDSEDHAFPYKVVY